MNISRKFKRDKEKKLYKDFCSKWEVEVNRQKVAIKSGQKLEENILLKRPSFSQWKELAKTILRLNTSTVVGHDVPISGSAF